MKLIERTENLKVHLNIELEQQFLKKFLPVRAGSMEPLNQCHA